jgi:hypothetical protein
MGIRAMRPPPTVICKEVKDLFAKLVSYSALQLLSFLFTHCRFPEREERPATKGALS